MKFVDATNLNPRKDSFYKSARVKVDVEEDKKVEVKCTMPVQVRVNGGEWRDVRQLDYSDEA